jgi:hypothetical protein
MNGASEGYIKRGYSISYPQYLEFRGRGSLCQKESKREQTASRAKEQQGGVNSRFSDAAEPHLHRDTGLLVWGIPVAAQGRSILSRDERVRKAPWWKRVSQEAASATQTATLPYKSQAS